MKLGFIVSGGGSAFFQALEILEEVGIVAKRDVFLISDRNSKAIERAKEMGLVVQRLDIPSNNLFSDECSRLLVSFGATDVLLFFSRLVTESLYMNIRTCNIHPSLLPLFPGFGALQSSLRAGVKMIGATLHEVDGSIDNGKIIAQVSSPMPIDWTLDMAQRVSFVQKVYLTLIFVERSSGLRSKRTTPSASPALQNPFLIKKFDEFLATRHETVFVP